MIVSKKLINFFILIFLINVIVLNLYKTRIETSHKFSIYQIFEKKPTIFCIILTNPNNFLTKTLVVNNTWAQECDEHKFLSVIPDFYLNVSRESNQETYKETYQGETLEISYPFKLLQPSGFREERYNALTTKMYKSYIDIHKLYPNYDWYLKADDDTYIFMDHLRAFLHEKNPSDLITYGFNLKKFQSGGAGYVMSNSVLNLFGMNMLKNESFCRNEGREDLDLAACLRQSLNVTAGSTEDELGRERFHPYNIKETLNGLNHSWLNEMTVNPIKKGFDSSSSQSISYHYMKPEEILQTHVAWKAYQKLIAENKNLDFHQFVLSRFI